ncbi:PRD domain-containing protein [Marinilactibacillus psychrotolerans]|uniref:PRD domain-containing protein n=1 Tax=Marinilactibacillus psychrotolerans TaxID=191770 RepID=A0AAV3WRU4_9LACT|nr:PRD domain-containing protein [Marinilactibacillus psychrotolerans]GEL67626.1 hypothetical protein MPS01_17810 [Marinilactibacillus psychrotolerans]GEQ35490.1 hypothetical protein M132T_09980 [Marinilactibacillus psychrotolerans]SDD06881.1 PRD domain-containing protein [Marinilactibacillus psychrotolerans]
MIQEKLIILKENKVIDQETFEYAQEALMFLINRNIVENEEEADVFITHLAMATARQNTDEMIDGIDEIIKQEIENDEKYEEAIEIWKELKVIAPTTFSQDEDGYFHLHLVTLLRN